LALQAWWALNRLLLLSVEFFVFLEACVNNEVGSFQSIPKDAEGHQQILDNEGWSNIHVAQQRMVARGYTDRKKYEVASQMTSRLIRPLLP
jgi:hypothetical protein